MSTRKRPSMQDIIRRRQREEFIGREDQLTLFRRNLALSPEDPQRLFIFNIFGQGGVGKSTLLRRFRQLAENINAVTAWTEETETDVPEVMGRIANQFAQQGHELKSFGERYRVYRQRRQELETDPDAPQGFSAFFGRTLVKSGIRLARHIPIGGMVADLVNEETLATYASEWMAFLTRKLTNKDEVRLLREPVEVLTTLFLEDLDILAEQHPITLFFDTYERTAEHLDAWLLDLLDGRHGAMPSNIVLVIAGRDELNRNRWAPYEALLIRLSLEPFSEEETRTYLVHQGVTNEQVIDVILRLSGRLPLLVATLAAESPSDPDQVGDPTDTAIERFLKWVDDPRRQQIALDAALPRRLNQDVLAILVGDQDASQLFTWLKTLPFVEERGDSWVYHEVVRDQILRHKHHQSPKDWADLHGRLASFYQKLREEQGLDDEQGRRDPTWQAYALELLYHMLCQAPRRHLPFALNGFLAALNAPSQHVFARRWPETLLQAGKDAEVDEVQHWGQRLVQGLKAYDEERYEDTSAMFTALLEYSEIENRYRSIALSWRGNTRRLLERYAEALVDFDQAIELVPNNAWAIARRGITYSLLNRYKTALEDFNHAIELDPSDVWAIAQRGEVYGQMEHHQEALADFSHVIEFDSKNIFAHERRGYIYRELSRYEEALTDLSLAIGKLYGSSEIGLNEARLGRDIIR